MFTLTEHTLFRQQRFAYTRLIFQSLSRLHQSGRLHLALTPGHILIAADEVRIREASGGENLLLEARRYAAPEILAGHKGGPESDVYALGRMLFEAWSGALPDDTGQAPALTTWLPELPQAIDGFFQTLTARDPDRRFADADAALREFQALEAAYYPQPAAALFIAREAELTDLSDWLRQTRGGVYCIAGSAGVGKSSLIQRALKDVLSLSGKFQQARAYPAPYAVFVEAMQAFLTGVLSLPAPDRTAWKQALQAELGLQAQILYQPLPELQMLLETATHPQTDSGLMLENPFKRAFARLWQAVHARQRLTVWLDDVQWADESSRQFFELLLPFGIVWILSGRDLKGFESLLQAAASPGCRRLTLETFTPAATHDYLQQALQADAGATLALVPVLQALSQGNPLYLKICLNDFERRGLLQFDPSERQWHLQLAGDWARHRFSEQFLQEIMERRLAALPAIAQEALGLAACLGTRFTLAALATCLNQPEAGLRSTLKTCERTGLILAAPSGQYRFAHDRLHEWILRSLSAQEQTRLRLRAGRALLGASVADTLNPLIETLNPVAGLLSPAECSQLIEANLVLIDQVLRQGAQREAADLIAAVRRLDFPLNDAQDMKLSVLEAFLDYLAADFVSAEARLKELLVKYPAANLTEAYILLVILYTQQNRYAEAVDFTIGTLRQMGLDIQAAPEAVETIFLRCVQTLATLSPEDLQARCQRPSLPGFADKIRLFAAAAAGFYNYEPELFGVYVLYFLDQILHHQGADHAMTVFAAGIIVMTAQGLFPIANLIAEGGLLVASASGHLDDLSTLHFVIGDFLAAWQQPYAQACEHFEHSWQAGLQSGNLQFAGYSCVYKITNLLLSGASLQRLQEQELPAKLAFNATIQNLSPLDGLKGYALLLHALRQQAGVFDLPELSEADYLALLREHGSRLEQERYLSFKAFVLLLFGETERAREAYAQSELPRFLPGSVINVQHLFTGLMLDLRQHQARHSDAWQADLQKLASYAELCPANFSALYALVQAESSWLPELERIEHYEHAITQARQFGLCQIEGLALECQATFWQSQNLLRPAQQALYDSLLAYEQWGASQKVRHLLEQLPQGLRLRYEQQAQQAQTAPDLDLLMEISALFARTTRLDELLAAIMNILQSQTRAESLYLLVPGDGQADTAVSAWECLARFEAGQLDLTRRALFTAHEAELPVALIRYVIQTRRVLRLPRHLEILSQIPEALPLKGSHFLLPLVLQNRLEGLIYLRSDADSEAFSLREELLLKALAGHIASSLTNARLYGQLEATIAERTHALQSANQELKHLLQERQQVIAMAAHDLKHPLGTLTLAVSMLEQMYEQLSPDARGEVFLSLNKTLRDMNGNTERLLLAERLDFEPFEPQLQTVSVVPEILDWLQPYQALAHEKQIALELCGFTTGHLQSDPMLLRQILENLVSNAIKFSSGGSRIRVLCSVDEAQFRFWVEDEGPGIPAEEQGRLFQKFARLSPQPTAGESSSGLGLYIAQQFVTRLGGRIEIDSEPGRGTSMSVWIPQTSQESQNFQLSGVRLGV